jgi:DNA-3-methyladenine glycosylase
LAKTKQKLKKLSKKFLPLPPKFYDRDTVKVARDLLGKLLVRKIGRRILSGVIIETEAYTQNDPACHAARGKTPRNAVMFGEPGHAYVYFIYGNHFCLNAVTESHGTPGAVLIRALIPVDGIEIMRRNRLGNLQACGAQRRNIFSDENLTNGPGKLCQALSIGRAENGIDLTGRGLVRGKLSWGGLVIVDYNIGKFKIGCSPRIGISQAQDRLWRFNAIMQGK